MQAKKFKKMNALIKHWNFPTGIFKVPNFTCNSDFLEKKLKILILIRFSELKTPKKIDPCITPVLRPPPPMGVP